MRKTFKKVAATLAACTMAFALAAGVVPSAVDASVQCSKAGKKAGKADVDLAGTYHAYFGFQQTDSWVFRNAWYDPELGLDGKFKDDASYDQMLTSLDVSDPVPVGGTVTDVEIKGNGTYTVGVSGLDATKLNSDASKISLLFASTDIPSKAVKDGTITFSDVKLSVDGVEKWSGEPFTNVDAEEWGLFQMDIVNTYQNEGYESPSIMLPTDSLEITFTVSGFDNDNPEAVEEKEEPADDGNAAAPTENVNNEDEKSGSSAAPIVIAIIAVVVVAGVVVVVVKKKKN